MVSRFSAMEKNPSKAKTNSNVTRAMAALVAATLAVSALVYPTSISLAAEPENSSFVHGITIATNEGDYYLAGAPDAIDGATDIPGHYWVQASPNQLVGKHYNTGPFGAPNWWSSDAADGELLYIVHARIGPWTPEIAEDMAKQGYIHYHELVSVEDGSLHPYLVVWLKHVARTSFTLDGGPHPELAHEVNPGVDYEFIPNGMVPYSP